MNNKNPYVSQFNSTTSYNVVGDQGVSVMPYQRSQVRPDVLTEAESKNYSNKFFNEKVYKRGEPSIKLNPDQLNDIKKNATQHKNTDNNVYSQTHVSYINVDSGQRIKTPVNVYDELLYSLPPYPLKFTNGSKLVTVTLQNHVFNVNDIVVLNNVISKNVVLKDVLMVKKNSFYVKITHINHGLSLYGMYDKSNPDEFVPVFYVDDLPVSFSATDDIPDGVGNYYILKKNESINLQISISNVNGNDALRSSIGNIPVNYINRKQTVFLLFVKVGTTFQSDPNHYLIRLKQKSSINYKDGVSMINDLSGQPTTTVSNNNEYIKFYNLFGVPLDYLNSGTPIDSDHKYTSVVVTGTTANTFTIDVNYPAIVDPIISFYNYTDYIDCEFDIAQLINNSNGGGNQCYVRRVIDTIPAYPNPNSYLFRLDKVYKNIIQAKIVSSVFRNSQRIINDQESDVINNKLYWRNLNDGGYIYNISITPGNYTAEQLAIAIEESFSNTIRYNYTTEFMAGIIPSVITSSTPLDDNVYDDNGYNKYHIVKVSISSITDVVSFSAFRELIQQDIPGQLQVLKVPDNILEFTAAENFRINFGSTGTGIVPFPVNPFDPDSGEVMFIYFTPNVHIRVISDYPYANGYLYQYIGPISPDTGTTNGYNSFTARLERTRAILTNFYRDKKVYPSVESTREMTSINTFTMFQNFSYDYILKKVILVDHNLHVSDLIITDQLVDPSFPNQIYVYEISSVINSESFYVNRYNHGEGYKFIYDGLIINFNNSPPSPTDNYYWADQIISSAPITALPFPYAQNNNTLSFTTITPSQEDKKFMYVYQPNHQLNVGDVVIIANSDAVNGVPMGAINTSHIINRVLDDNNYEVLIDKYTPVMSTSAIANIVSITYPEQFQMFFNFQDTIGRILSFNKVGEPVAVTPYEYTVKNTTPYTNDYNYYTLGSDYSQKLRQLVLTGYDYFYISSPELGHYHDTKPVSNVFAKIRWFGKPGSVVFDSFVPTVKNFDIPLSELSEINIAIYHPDGRLVEFNDIDHSFTIEIVEVFNQPDETNISVRLNSEMIVRKVN